LLKAVRTPRRYTGRVAASRRLEGSLKH